MKTSPIEEMIAAAIAECKYESQVSQALKEVLPKVEAAFPEASMPQIMFYLDKASKAKKNSIRRNIIG